MFQIFFSLNAIRIPMQIASCQLHNRGRNFVSSIFFFCISQKILSFIVNQMSVAFDVLCVFNLVPVQFMFFKNWNSDKSYNFKYRGSSVSTVQALHRVLFIKIEKYIFFLLLQINTLLLHFHHLCYLEFLLLLFLLLCFLPSHWPD